ncbi:hypothetical protein QR680_011678 [Steinernema hermaphroditum]|uniref:Uncharacterized protein n=1 Tax=Steinernema hermaphroditum TaxID=289476 RepID=A0AA39HZC3_9BILA|nr:hypothetical protein QR680_011678 [Steinernema hermaphroditum]
MSHLPTSSAVVHDQEDTEGGARDTTERLLNVIARLESSIDKQGNRDLIICFLSISISSTVIHAESAYDIVLSTLAWDQRYRRSAAIPMSTSVCTPFVKLVFANSHSDALEPPPPSPMFYAVQVSIKSRFIFN